MCGLPRSGCWQAAEREHRPRPTRHEPAGGYVVSLRVGVADPDVGWLGHWEEVVPLVGVGRARRVVPEVRAAVMIPRWTQYKGTVLVLLHVALGRPRWPPWHAAPSGRSSTSRLSTRLAFVTSPACTSKTSHSAW